MHSESTNQSAGQQTGPADTRGELARVIGYVNDARQLLELATMDRDNEPWALLQTPALAGVSRRLAAAVQLLEGIAAELPAAELPAAELTYPETVARIDAGEVPTIARPCDDDPAVCAECGQLLERHPVEFSRDGRRLVCIPAIDTGTYGA